MTPVQLVERLRSLGYDGPVSRKSVEKFLESDDAPELHLIDGDGEDMSLDDIWPKGLTLTVTRNESEPDTLELADGEAKSEDEEELEDELEQEQAKSRRLEKRLAALEAKTGMGATNRATKAATDRWNFSVPNPATADYKRAIKNGKHAATGRKAVFDDADKAAVAGAWFRYNAAQVAGRTYPQKTADLDILKKGGVSYDAGQGGSFTPGPEFRAEMVELQDEYGTARKLVPFQAIPKEGIGLPRWDSDLTVTWNTEGSTLADQDPSTSSVWLYPKKLTGYIKITNDLLLADAVGIVDQCFRSFSRAMANKEDNAFFLGDGTSTYGGIVGIANAIGSAGVKTQTTGSTWAAIVDADLQAWLGKLPHYAWQNGQLAFTCTSAAFFEIVNRLNMAKGGVTYREGANQSVIYQYNGIDFVWNNVMASATATSTNSAYFGSFGMGIKCGQHGTLQFAQSDQRHFDEDSIALRAVEYVDINCHDLGDSSDAGPVVALKTGS